MGFDSNEDFFARQAFEEGVRQGRVYGAAAERARIVAWLRGAAKDELQVDGVGVVATEAVLEAVARCIR